MARFTVQCLWNYTWCRQIICSQFLPLELSDYAINILFVDRRIVLNNTQFESLNFKWINVNKQTKKIKQRKIKHGRALKHVFSAGVRKQRELTYFSIFALLCCDYTIISERVVVILISFRVWHNDEWKRV